MLPIFFWGGVTHGPRSSSFWGLPYRILNISHNKELLRGLGVGKFQERLDLKPRLNGIGPKP